VTTQLRDTIRCVAGFARIRERDARLPRIAHFTLVIILTVLPGCATLFASRPALPARHTLVLDPLIVHSDFPMPPHHRLLDDVAAERGELMSKLNLPKSEESIHVYLFDTEASFHSFVEQHFPEFPARRAFFVETDTRLAV
jgi:hypothetical protein